DPNKWEDLVVCYAWNPRITIKEELRTLKDNTLSLWREDTQSSAPDTYIEDAFVDCYSDYLNRLEVKKTNGSVTRWIFMSPFVQNLLSFDEENEVVQPGDTEPTQFPVRRMLIDEFETIA
ncbi:unnamed protein product, partial [Linum tenue]